MLCCRARAKPGEPVGESVSKDIKDFAIKLVVLLALGGLVCYVVLPGVIEEQLAGRLQGTLGTPTKPEVEISSSFPPEMLLGRIDRVQVRADQMSLQGVPLYNARADLRGMNVSPQSLLKRSPSIETESCSLSVEAPAFSVDQDQACLGYPGLGPSSASRSGANQGGGG